MNKIARQVWRSVYFNTLASRRSTAIVHRSLATGPSFFVSTEAADRLAYGQPAVLLPEDGTVSFSDLGIGQSWWPSDLALSALELLHTDACLPWWACALTAGLAVRLVLVYPSLALHRLAQQQQQFQAEQQKQQPAKSSERIASLTEQLRAAQAVNNVAESRRLAQELRATATLSEAARESAPPGGIASLAGGFACQLGWLAGHLACLRAMSAAAAVPVPGWQTGGPTSWLADLTCSDPTGAGPALITLVLLVNARLALATTAAQPEPAVGNPASPGGLGQLWESGRPLAMTLGPAVFFTFLANCPSVLLFYFGATGVVAMATNLGLYLTALRRAKTVR
ncbi:hypothetical protein BOX15_Mlig027970g1 [Macrostomum lignano]|uniref:Uncharacterized protein n=1 Tax=Macrostomum lignano TaxID=282301 RepID=A0A267F0T1_9PLAT|nr:hypothetical protein BOX15_Mlig027970g1 [Macrostomum lignano]